MLNVTAADYAIYYSNSFDLETRLQSEDRCHRIGTKNNITYIDIEAPKTIDTSYITPDKKSCMIKILLFLDSYCL